MSNVHNSNSVSAHFAGKDPSVQELCGRLMSGLSRFGPIKEEPKKTSIHLFNASAHSEVQVRKSYLLLNLKGDHRIENPRIQKTEQISAGRFQQGIKVAPRKSLRGNERAGSKRRTS